MLVRTEKDNRLKVSQKVFYLHGLNLYFTLRCLSSVTRLLSVPAGGRGRAAVHESDQRSVSWYWYVSLTHTETHTVIISCRPSTNECETPERLQSSNLNLSSCGFIFLQTQSVF